MVFTSTAKKVVAAVTALIISYSATGFFAYQWGKTTEQKRYAQVIKGYQDAADKYKKEAGDAGLDAANIKGQLAAAEKRILQLKADKAAAEAKLPKEGISTTVADPVRLDPNVVPVLKTAEEREVEYKKLLAITNELQKELEAALDLCKQENQKRLLQINKLTAAEQARALEVQATLAKLSKEVKSKEFYRNTAGVTAVLLLLKLFVK